MAKTERERQYRAAMEAASETGSAVYRYHFVCGLWPEDPFTFSAIAPSESGALRVFNAEHPGRYAESDGRTHCFRDSAVAWEAHKDRQLARYLRGE